MTGSRRNQQQQALKGLGGKPQAEAMVAGVRCQPLSAREW